MSVTVIIDGNIKFGLKLRISCYCKALQMFKIFIMECGPASSMLLVQT